MKISEMTNAQATEAIIRIADPVAHLCDDEEITKILTEFHDAGETSLIQNVGRLLPRFVAYSFKKHIDDLYEIIGALTFQTREQVERMNFAETIRTIKESYDDVLAGFFTKSSPTEGKKDGN